MRTFLVYLIFLLGINARAQIVIKESQYPASVLGKDTIITTATSSAFPSLSPLSGGLIDMSVLSDSATIFFDYRLPTAGYEFADSNDYQLWRYPYKGNIQSSIVTAGIMDYGMNVMDTTFSLSTLTFTSTDSLFIPAQSIVYSSPCIRIPFTTTYGDSWSSAYTRDLGFELSTALPLLNHAPGFVRSYFYVASNVVGWGKVRINDINGLPGPYLDILQIQTRTIKQDSFYLNSGLMPGTLLTLFGVYQGKTDTVFEQKYQRQGEVTPLVTVTFKDGTYTQPVRAKRHVQRLSPFVDGIGDVKMGVMSVSPNPVYGKTLKLKLPSAVYQYKIIDVMGCVEAYGNVTITESDNEIELPAHILNGSYYLQVSNNGDSRTIPVQILR